MIVYIFGGGSVVGANTKTTSNASELAAISVSLKRPLADLATLGMPGGASPRRSLRQAAGANGRRAVLV